MADKHPGDGCISALTIAVFAIAILTFGIFVQGVLIPLASTPNHVVTINVVPTNSPTATATATILAIAVLPTVTAIQSTAFVAPTLIPPTPAGSVWPTTIPATATSIPVAPTATPVPTIAPTDTPWPTDAAIPPTATLAWYVGGTLHNATVAEWRTAEQRNKLATAADWAANGFDLNTYADIEAYAPQLLICVEEVSEVYPEPHSVADLAAGCIILMKNP